MIPSFTQKGGTTCRITHFLAMILLNTHIFGIISNLKIDSSLRLSIREQSFFTEKDLKSEIKLPFISEGFLSDFVL